MAREVGRGSGERGTRGHFGGGKWRVSLDRGGCDLVGGGGGEDCIGRGMQDRG